MKTALATIALWVTMCLASTAAAQDREPDPSDKETARSLFREGDEKFRAGDYKNALKAFTAADDLVRLPTTGLEVGRTLMMMGRLLEARDIFLKVSRLEKKADEQAAQQTARAEAQALAETLEQKIPAIRVVVRGPQVTAPVTLSIDGHDVAGTALDFPRKVDPGDHVVRVRVEGYRTDMRRVTVLEGEEKVIEVTLVRATGTEPEPEPDLPPPDDEVEDGGSGMPVLSWIGFSLGVAGLAMAIPTGIIALDKQGELDGKCPGGVCPKEQEDELEEARTIAHVSTAGCVIAGVGIAVGVIGLIVGDDLPDALAGTELTIGPFGGSLRTRF
jgi:hypothetical protein